MAASTKAWRAGRRTGDALTRPSTIDVLPPEIQSEIGRLRLQGCTIDQIVAHLRAMHGVTTVSRTAMGRHLKGLEKVTEQIRRSREIAVALATQFGDAPGSQVAQVNIELLHSTLLNLQLKADEDGEIDAGGLAALAGNPEGISLLARAIKDLAAASKTNADFIEKVEKRAEDKARKDAVARVEVISRERGIGSETLEAIKAGIFGVKVGS